MNGESAEVSGSGPTSAAHQLLRAALDSDKVTDSQVSQYYRERLQDRRIQITNLDRDRPKTGGNDADARLRAERKLIKRKRRVKSELSSSNGFASQQVDRSNAQKLSSDDRTPFRAECEEDGQDNGTRELVKGKQRLLSDANKQLRRLQSAPRTRANEAK